MSESNIKAEIARRQLGTALALFLADDDPVSVHVLACGGGEVSEFLATRAGKRPFSQHALEMYHDMKRTELQFLRNRYWNAMKHAISQNGKIRNDNELLSNFNDNHNDHVLFIGWYDYASAIRSIPIEAQVFQVWYFANFPEKLSEEFPASNFTNVFPKISSMKRRQKKQALRRKIAWARTQPSIMNHQRTERRKLILSQSFSSLNQSTIDYES